MKLLGLQDLEGKYILTNVESDKELNILELYLETTREKKCCPKCGNHTDKKKDSRIRKVNHGEFNGTKCVIHLKYNRDKCSECNSSFYEEISNICEKYCRHTNVAILNVMSTLADYKMSVKDIAKMNNMDRRLINKLFDLRVYELGLNNVTTLPANIGIDEFKGNMKVDIDGKKVKSKYQIQITDLDTSKIIVVLPIKSEKCILEFLNKITNKNEVKNVVIDMSMQFKRILKSNFKNALITVDYFHVTKLVTTAVDKIRLDLWRKYTDEKSAEAKDIRKYLKSIKNYLLTDYVACKDEAYKKKIDAKLTDIFKYAPELKVAYEILQEFYDIKRKESSEAKSEAFNNWFKSIDNIEQFKSVKKTIFHWYTYIKNYFITNLSNGKTEGNNNSVKVLKRSSYGFRNFKNAANRILVCC